MAYFELHSHVPVRVGAGALKLFVKEQAIVARVSQNLDDQGGNS